ncbi:MAG TPA: histidine kinase [Mycobacteriales bacterium]|nr:histidine kinase [Mycobacteriales bacterium]
MRNPITLLALLAAAVLGLGSLDLHQHYRLGLVAALGLSLLRAAPLALARSRPLVAWAGTLAATVLTAVATRPVSADEPWPWAVTSMLAALPVLAVLGARMSPPALAGVWASVVATGAVPLLVAPDRGRWAGLLPALALTAAALAGGYLVRGRADARQNVLHSEAEREVLRERARIARELHDVIAHGLSVVTVRADSAPHRLPDVSPAVAAEFDAIAEAARQSLTELRHVLGVLRDPGAGSGTAPLPGLADLPALVGGVPLTVTGTDREVPAAVQLTAYRLVQEALSNVRRHAPSASASVTVGTEPGSLRVTVVNSAGGDGVPGRGYGLAGMRERVALVGGRLDAGPRPDGGWRVDAALPLDQPGPSGAGPDPSGVSRGQGDG